MKDWLNLYCGPQSNALSHKEKICEKLFEKYPILKRDGGAGIYSQ